MSFHWGMPLNHADSVRHNEAFHRAIRRTLPAGYAIPARQAHGQDCPLIGRNSLGGYDAASQ
jgi:hypothetical protein